MNRAKDALIVPDAPVSHKGDVEDDFGWGFKDTRFEVLPNGNVVLTGSRYNLCGIEMPKLLPWMSKMLAAPLNPDDRMEPRVAQPAAPAADVSPFVKRLAGALSESQMSTDGMVRLRHGHGHTGLEVYELLYGSLRRIPDLVVFPETEAQVAAIVAAAQGCEVVLIPYGGGTNVTKALECPDTEARPIVSVDMQRLNRVLWIDRGNCLAKIQAGAPGRTIIEQLRQYGFTMGHEPDSVEFSTLGGWIATNCSGMKRNRYGNIEDIVVDVSAVTAHGVVERFAQVPRESAGIDSRRCLFGSEGTLGIVTSATVKIHPLPEVQRFGSLIFPSFEAGFSFLRELQHENLVPASIRLIDNDQFHFGMALKPTATRLEQLKSSFARWMLGSVKGIDFNACSLATIVFEGSAREVRIQERELYRVARRHGGIAAGPENGQRGYNLTFGIAYLRDLVFRHHMIAESFETSVSWSGALELCRRVRERCFAKHRELGLPGQPFFTLRVTQLYQTGICIYFYLGFFAKGVDQPMHQYAELEDAAREEILACGGSISHHHGVGKLRARFLDQIQTVAMNEVNRRLKLALDPADVFANRNQAVLGAARAPQRSVEVEVERQRSGAPNAIADTPRATSSAS